MSAQNILSLFDPCRVENLIRLHAEFTSQNNALKAKKKTSKDDDEDIFASFDQFESTTDPSPPPQVKVAPSPPKGRLTPYQYICAESFPDTAEVQMRKKASRGSLTQEIRDSKLSLAGKRRSFFFEDPRVLHIDIEASSSSDASGSEEESTYNTDEPGQDFLENLDGHFNNADGAMDYIDDDDLSAPYSNLVQNTPSFYRSTSYRIAADVQNTVIPPGVKGPPPPEGIVPATPKKIIKPSPLAKSERVSSRTSLHRESSEESLEDFAFSPPKTLVRERAVTPDRHARSSDGSLSFSRDGSAAKANDILPPDNYSAHHRSISSASQSLRHWYFWN
jgi:hypothetical protein